MVKVQEALTKTEMEKLTEETAVDLMQLMLDEEWVREAVRIEEEAGCDIGAVTSSLSIELQHTLTELNDAVAQVAHSGNSEQTNRVRNLLVQVKREIYKLLAEQ